MGVRDQRAVVPARDLVAAERPAPAAGAGHERAAGHASAARPGSRSRGTTASSASASSSSSRSRCCRCPSSVRCPRWPTGTSASRPRAPSTDCSTPASASAPSSARSPSERCSPTASSSASCASGLVVFAVFLAVFSLLRSPALAYPAILLVGLAYFAVITSLSTVLQQRLDDGNRGRVMALWIMGFGGTVPIGNLIAGPDHRGHLGDPGRLRRSHRRRRAWRATPTSNPPGPRPPTTPPWRPPTERCHRAVGRPGPQPARRSSARRSRPATRLPFTRTASPSARSPRAATASSIDATSSPP